MIRRIATVVALVALASACSWPTAGYDSSRRAWSPDRTITPENVKDLKALWGPINASGEVIGTRDVIVTYGLGGTVARNPATGAELWRGGGEADGVPAIADGTVITAGGTTTCAVRQFDLASGAAVREVRVGTEFVDDPLTTACMTGPAVLVDEEHVVVTTASVVTRASAGCAAASPPQLWGLTTSVTVMDRTLAPRWELADAHLGCGSPPPLTHLSPPDVARVGDRYLVTRDHDVLGLPVDCAMPCIPEWTHSYANNPVALMGLGPGDGYVQVSAKPTVFDTATGAVRWVGTGSAQFFTAAATDEFIFTAGTTVRAYPVRGCGAATCDPSWSVFLDSYVAPTQPVSVAGDLVFTGQWEGPGYILDARGCGAPTCRAVGAVASGWLGRTTVIAGRVYVPAQTGLVAYALPSG